MTLSNDDQVDITPRAEVLREAESLITGDRNDTYGTPTQNFTNIAELWNVQFRHKLKDGETFTPADVALAMIHVKMGRMVAQPKRDNWVDLAGYAACGYETTVEKPKETINPSPLTGVVGPGTVYPYPYTINVTASKDISADDVAAAVRGVTSARGRPVKDSPHECGPAC